MTGNLNIDQLRELYSSNPTARAFLDTAAQRERNQSETKVERVLKVLNSDGYDISRGQVIDVFKSLQDIGCGQFVPGRHGWPSRFVWSAEMISVGRAAAGESRDVAELATDESESKYDWLTHSFYLRSDAEVSLELPNDLTPDEAERLAMFVRALPFDRDS